MIEALVSFVVVAVFLLFMIRLARPSRGDTTLHAHRFSFLGRYDDSRSIWPSLIIGALAVGTLVSFGTLSGGGLTAGVIVGLGCALAWSLGAELVAQLVLAYVSLWAAVDELRSLSQLVDSSWALGAKSTYLLLIVLSACYLGGMVVGGVRSALSPRRLLIYFAMVDVLVFLVSPGGVQVYQLDPSSIVIYIVVTAVSAFLLGLIPAAIVTALAAAGVALTNLVLDHAALGGRVTVLVAALVVAAAVRGIVSRFTRVATS